MTTSVNGTEISAYEYSDYTTTGNVQYPQTIKVMYAGKPLVSGKMTVSRTEKFADTIFAAPAGATTTDWASCADVDKNFTAPHMIKSVPPKMSDAAKKAKKYGLVWVMESFSKDGSVSKATVLGGDPDLNAAATEAAQQYKFSPYTRCGQAVEFQKADRGTVPPREESGPGTRGYFRKVTTSRSSPETRVGFLASASGGLRPAFFIA